MFGDLLGCFLAYFIETVISYNYESPIAALVQVRANIHTENLSSSVKSHTDNEAVD